MTDGYELGQAIEGFVLGPEGDERAARLEARPDALVIQAGDEEHRIPWRGVRLERREGDDVLLVRGKRLVAGSADPDLLRALEGAGGNELDRELARLVGDKTSRRGCQIVGCLAFFLLIAFVIYSIPGCFRGSVDATVDALPYTVDVSLGEMAWESMELGPTFEDELVQETIEAMIERLAPSFPGPEFEWHVRVVRNDDVNAFALPGGFVTVYTGLIAAAEKPEMVAGVLAHEMAHVIRRHGLRRVAHQLGTMAIIQLVLGDTGGLSSIAKEVLTVATVNDYSQDQETDADLVGARAMAKSGIDPMELAAFFLLLQEEMGDIPGALAWASSHPQHRERINALEVLSNELDGTARRPIEVDWEEVQARVNG